MIAFRSNRISDLRQALALHASKLPADSPLRRVLGSPDIETRIGQFDWADATALKAQKSYRRLRILSLWATMIATVVGATVLLPIDDWIAGLPRLLIQVVQALALILALFATVWIGLSQSVDQWLQARAVAERLRADVFRAIMREGARTSELLAPALACFKDAHLDRQLSFYRKRGAQHRRSAGNAGPYRLVGYALLAVAVVVGSVGLAQLAANYDLLWTQLEPLLRLARIDQPNRWQLGLGAIASGVLAFANARSFMEQDDRNASIYARVAAELERIEQHDLPKAQAAAATGNAPDVSRFTENIQKVLDAEHLAWGFRVSAEQGLDRR